MGVKKRPKNNKQEFMLTYEVDETMTSMVTLQISADDIILIYNRLEYNDWFSRAWVTRPKGVFMCTGEQGTFFYLASNAGNSDESLETRNLAEGELGTISVLFLVPRLPMAESTELPYSWL